MPPQDKKVSNHHKGMCGCKICISTSMIQCELDARRSIYTEKLRLFLEISYSKRSGQERKKTNTLIKGIKNVLTNIKEEVMHKSLSIV